MPLPFGPVAREEEAFEFRRHCSRAYSVRYCFSLQFGDLKFLELPPQASCHREWRMSQVSGVSPFEASDLAENPRFDPPTLLHFLRA